jgi:translocation and assembly module TamB
LLEPASQGRIALDASVGLMKWSYTSTSPIQVSLNASELEVTDLTKAAGKQVPVTGVLAMKVNMHGTELHPVGQGDLLLSHLIAYNEPVRSARVTFSGTGDEVHGSLDISLPAGQLQSTMSVRPQEKIYVAQVTANDIRVERLETVRARNLDAIGGVNLHASGGGMFDNPQVDVTLQIPELVVQKQAIRMLNLQMNMANHIATANLTSQAINTSVRANAKVDLMGDT